MAKKKSKKEKEMSEPKSKYMLISRLNHPVTLAYGGNGLLLPPRGRIKNVDKNLLGALPKGVVCAAQPEPKPPTYFGKDKKIHVLK